MSKNTISSEKLPNTFNYRDDVPISVRIAIYDNMTSIPRVIDIESKTINNFINETSQKIYNLSHEIGGKIPYTIIKEIVENLIHANFSEITITILNNGNHIIVSDQGPGIEDKKKVFLPGYTSATKDMKKYIRGVGSGLPIVNETITLSGGSIEITDNIKKGAVISLKLDSLQKNSHLPITINKDTASSSTGDSEITDSGDNSLYEFKKPDELLLSLRQTKMLFLILELEQSGPSKIAKELGFSLSTSYRDLVYLEKKKLLTSASPGKRKLTPKGIKYLDYYSKNF